MADCDHGAVTPTPRRSMTELDCPSKRCSGQLGDPDAVGTDNAGRHVEWRTCLKCGRLTETEVAPDDRQLNLLEADNG